MSRLRPPSLACSALCLFSRGAGKGGRKGKSGRRSTLVEEAAGGRCAGDGGGNLWGGRSCCRCHCYRRCHIGFLLYRQPLRSCDRSRAAVTTVRSGLGNERARAPASRARPQSERAGWTRRLATPLPFRSPPVLRSMRVREGRQQPATDAPWPRPRRKSACGSGTPAFRGGLLSGPRPRARRQGGPERLERARHVSSRVALPTRSSNEPRFAFLH